MEMEGVGVSKKLKLTLKRQKYLGWAARAETTNNRRRRC